MRAFVALELPGKIKGELEKIQGRLRKTDIRARWVKPKLAHLTLVFFGSITPDRVGLIAKILNKKASQIGQLNFYLLRIGCFPNPARARVVFVSLGGELEKLNTLVKKIRKELKKEGVWFDKKPFTAHITLGRIKKSPNLTAIIKKAKVRKIKFTTDRVALVESRLTKTGPVYKTLKQIKLVGKNGNNKI